MQYAKRFFNRYASMQAIQEFKDKYCPDGQTCDNIVMFGGMVFIVLVHVCSYVTNNVMIITEHSVRKITRESRLKLMLGALVFL